jgi:SPX domain protein involved in polyphosphate accumulation
MPAFIMAITSDAVRRFDRYELKYLVPITQLPAIAEDLMLHMQPDRHGDQAGSYAITNLYYDSAELHMLQSKLAGTSYRRKLRVRVYGESPACAGTIAMVEIKQRLRRTTQKRRLVLTLPEAYRLCSGSKPRGSLVAADAAVADEVGALVLSMQLRPACIVAYKRRAFVGSRFEPGLRVTFDTDLWCAPPDLGLSIPSHPRYVMPRGWSILEIKVDERLPMWVSEMVVKHDCRLQRVSKYCLGMVSLHRLQVPMNSWAPTDGASSFSYTRPAGRASEDGPNLQARER